MPPITFEWGKGNENKSVHKHQITNIEAESIFSDTRNHTEPDLKHSYVEKRYICIGKKLLRPNSIYVFLYKKRKHKNHWNPISQQEKPRAV